MKEPYIAAIGTACMDEYYCAESWVEEGGKLLVKPLEAQVGGMIPNAASVMAGYQDDIYLVDYMNDGAVSRKIKKNLNYYNVDTSFIETDNRLEDAKCLIILTKKERTIFVVDYPKPQRILPARTLEMLRGAAFVYTTMTELRRFKNYELLADDLRSHGVRLVFDVEDSTFQDETDSLFQKADILFFNRAGLDKYCHGSEPEECIEKLLRGGCGIVVTTLGAEGCDCHSPEEHVRLKGLPAKVLDTTGAGDTFNASFVHCLMRGCSLSEAAEFSNAAAARATEILGPKGGVAEAGAVEKYMRKQRERKESE